MLETYAEIEKEIRKCDLLYEKGIYDDATYVKRMRYIKKCYNYIKHYNKLYSNYSKYSKKTKTKTK